MAGFINYSKLESGNTEALALKSTPHTYADFIAQTLQDNDSKAEDLMDEIIKPSPDSAHRHVNMELVNPELKSKWSRLSRISWAEARCRIGQEGSKRLDLILHHLKLERQAQPRLLPTESRTGYFFARNSDEVAHRAALLREHLPLEMESILGNADRICEHEFSLLGYEELKSGSDIDWHADLVHGKRSALRPWYKLSYLNFNEVGDHKIIWELNRHQHLITLAKAWRLSGDPRYANEFVQQCYSWHQGNPYPMGINWASALEVAFRSLSWLFALELLEGCPVLSATFSADMLSSLQRHGRHIERYLSTYFSPNTHLIGEAVALFFLGVLCPELGAADRWKAKGWEVLQQEAKHQIRPDGVYFEQSLYYHVYALDFFLYARILADRNGHKIPDEFDNVIRKMLDVVDALSEFGAVEGFGDDDGGRLFNPRRNRVEHLTDPLALGSALYGVRFATFPLTEEAVWLFGDYAVEYGSKLKPGPQAQSRAFSSGGIYLINDLEPRPQQMMIDAGPQGTSRSGHGHADALSVRMSVGSQRVLIDPGTYCYIGSGNERNRFRGTASHNTLRVDNLDQAIPEGPFAWSSIPNVTAEKWVTGETFTFFSGSHDGYARLSQPVLHRRFVFHVKGRLWLIRDLAEGDGNHTLEVSWHLAPDLELKELIPERVITANPVGSADSGELSIAFLLDTKSAWKTELTESLASPAYGAKQSVPLIRSAIKAKLPQDYAALLLTSVTATDIGTFAAVNEGLEESVRGYSHKTGKCCEFVFFGSDQLSWSCGLWHSDASFLYCRLNQGRLAHVIMVSGSFVEYRGERFISNSRVVESFEWSDCRDLTAHSSNHSSSVERFNANLEFIDSQL